MICNSELNWFPPQYLKKNENWQFSIKKVPKSAWSPLNPLINPRLTFFPNMTPHTNDDPYWLLPSCKKLEIFNERFPRKCLKNKIFDTYSPLIPRLSFFPNMTPHSNDAPYFLLPSCKKRETFNDQFWRKCPKTPIFET